MFENVRTGLLTALNEDHKNQMEETNSYWGEITNYSYDFFYAQRMTGLIKELKKSDIHAFYMKYIHHGSETRSKLSVHVYSPRLQTEDVQPAIKVLEEHGFSGKDLDKVLSEKPRNDALVEAVEELLKTKPDLHHCCHEEILQAVKATNGLPEVAKELKGAEATGSHKLRGLMKLGEPRKPFMEYYDGPAKL